MSNLIQSPLRYPGSKSSLTDHLEAFVNLNALYSGTICEPFAGSGIVSFELLARRVVKKAILIEIDPLVYSFLAAALDSPDDLCGKIDKIDISLRTWHEFQKFREAKNSQNYSVLDLATACVFFNRTNFSGIIGAGPIGGATQSSSYSIDCRFNRARIIDQVYRMSRFASQTEVRLSDGLQELTKKCRQDVDAGAFYYVDPPYFDAGDKLYRYFFSEHQHSELATALLSMDTPWLVSYADEPHIRQLYSTANMSEVSLDYSVKSPKRGRELLISNASIPLLQERCKGHAIRLAERTGLTNSNRTTPPC